MMSSNNIIVQEYLGSLKEDKELDFLFPRLLSVMGYRIVQTALESKGKLQYGKDIIAIGKDKDGIMFRWYFELKGYKDKDINDVNFFQPDGILDSIIAAKYADFSDSSIPDFNKLPIKIVTVHNGVLDPNTRLTFEGFITREFNTKELQYERWDIYHLTDLFSEFLFGEYLLSDSESNRLLKRTLAFLDAPDYDYNDLSKLIDLQIVKFNSKNRRALIKFFATLNLLSSIIYHYSKENNNLNSAKKCSDLILLKTWTWVLHNKLERKKKITDEFRKLISTQYLILNEYFAKTFPVASIENGLYAENGHIFEVIGYPLRCFEYSNDLIYFHILCQYLPDFTNISNNLSKVRQQQKDELINLIENNSGFYRPIIDNNSIAILNIVLFFADKTDMRQKDFEFIVFYVSKIVEGLVLTKLKKNRLPEGYNRIEYVSEFIATGEKPYEYVDQSSILIAVLLELVAIFNLKTNYEIMKRHLTKNLSLQIAHPNFSEYNVEELLFEKHMEDEYYVVTDFDLPDDFDEFKKSVFSKEINTYCYRTDEAGFPFLRILAHNFYKNEIFPAEWRKSFDE